MAEEEKSEKENADADRDGRVSEIKNRPDPETQKINHGADADPINPVSQGTAQNEPNPQVVSYSLRRSPETDDRQYQNTDRDDHKQNLVTALEKPKGDTPVLDKGEMKNRRQDGMADSRA